MFKRWLIAVWMILSELSFGCNTYQSVQFSVRDAETGKPIPKARIGVHYFYVLDPFPPRDASTITDAHGDATMPVTNCSRSFGALANGYIPLTSQTGFDRLDDTQRVWLYRMPRPTVEIVVPDGYRGLLTIFREPTESRIQEAPGKRQFVFHASTAGAVHITTTPLLQDSS